MDRQTQIVLDILVQRPSHMSKEKGFDIKVDENSIQAHFGSSIVKGGNDFEDGLNPRLRPGPEFGIFNKAQVKL